MERVSENGGSTILPSAAAAPSRFPISFASTILVDRAHGDRNPSDLRDHFQLEQQASYRSQRAAIEAIATKIGCKPQALWKWFVAQVFAPRLRWHLRRAVFAARIKPGPVCRLDSSSRLFDEP